MMIEIRPPESIFQTDGVIQNGTFHGRWHFSFDTYRDPAHIRFGTLRVFNDDTLSPGAIWPLHPHTQNEVVTYVASGEFRHEDEHGKGGLLRKGWVQHTTVGRGMFHSEINARSDMPMRFIQMWFLPEELNLEPSVEQKAVDRADRTGRWFALVSQTQPGALPIRSDAHVLAAYLPPGGSLEHDLPAGRGAYLYVVEGGPIMLGAQQMVPLSAAAITGPETIAVSTALEAELLLIDVNLGDLRAP
ncbi:MAG: pirin family protein [Thermoplasmata archaeon]